MISNISPIRRIQLFLEQQKKDLGPLDYEELLLLLREAADYERGITWERDDQEPVIHRILTDPSGSSFSSRYDYAQQVVNLYRATVAIASSLPESYGTSSRRRERLINLLNQYAILKVEEAVSIAEEKDCAKYLKQTNGEIIGILKNTLLQEYSYKKIESLLRTAEGYASLGDERQHKIETVTQITETKQIVQTDYPVNKITPTQRENIRYCEEKEWFRALNPVEQGLFLQYREALLEGRVISNILKSVPCLRNAYYKEITERDTHPDGSITTKVLGRYLHSAAPSANQDDRELREELTRGNYHQLHPNPNIEADVMTLCSRVPGQTWMERHFPKLSALIFDKYVVDSLSAALPKAKLLVIPINTLRWCSKNTIAESCTSLLEAYKRKYPELGEKGCVNILKYLDEAPSFFGHADTLKSAKEKAYSLTDPGQKMLTLAVLELKRLSLKQSGWRGRLNSFIEVITNPFRKTPRNKNARIAGLLTTLWDAIHSDRVLTVSCKSGKDRTGYISLMSDALSVSMHNPDVPIEQIQSLLARASHAQFLASSVGCKAGCFGFKKVAGDEFAGISGSLSSSLFLSTAKTSSTLELDKKSANPSRNTSLSNFLAQLGEDAEEPGLPDDFLEDLSDTAPLLGAHRRRDRSTRESSDRFSLFSDEERRDEPSTSLSGTLDVSPLLPEGACKSTGKSQ